MALEYEMRTKLIEVARAARQWAYVPYSNYRVGAALLTESGKIYEGVNIENASYPATFCAEQVAVMKAVSEGERSFTAIAVSTNKGSIPCGVCRQVLSEFGLETIVLVVDSEGNLVAELTVGDMLPGAFTPEVFRKDQAGE
jgi:cytidine deaminase